MSSSAQDMRERLKRWPLVAQPSNRDEFFQKDARIVNGFVELDPNTGEYWVQKRIGYVVAHANLISFGLGRGMYTWYANPSPLPAPTNYCVIGNGLNASLFANGVVTGTPLGMADSAGNWSFTETQGATRYLVYAGVGLGGGANLYYTTGVGYTQATLPANRGNFIVGLAYLDGTIYFMDELGQIFGSALENPASWTTTNMIPAKKVPGIGTAFVRQLSYLLALKSSSMEVFYDGGGAPPGSPLLQIDGATTMFGCIAQPTVQTIDGVVLYATSNLTASPQIVRVDNLVPTIVSTPPIERLLDHAQVGGSLRSFVFKHGGHRFYGLSDEVQNITMVYDLDQGQRGMWYQWTDTNGGFFPMQSTGINSAFAHWFLHTGDGSIYQFEGDYSFPTDNGVVVPVDIYTPNEDFGTRRRKTMFRKYIRADQTQGSTLWVSHSDDDYQSWSTPRKVDLSVKTPYIDNEGTFVKRAYRYRHFAPTAFRIRSADLQMELGTI